MKTVAAMNSAEHQTIQISPSPEFQRTIEGYAKLHGESPEGYVIVFASEPLPLGAGVWSRVSHPLRGPHLARWSMLIAPVARSVVPGSTATFSTAVSSVTVATYQWFKDGVAIAGATGLTLDVADISWVSPWL